MSDEIIVKQCSPTLAGIKTGNLFMVRFNSKEELKEELRELNRRFAAKGVRVLPVRYGEDRVLIYFYRPDFLRRDLADHETEKLLYEMGYDCSSPEQYIVELIKKFQDTSRFPHEIGLFLGYPPEDVRGFIENKADNYKCVGTWKVYGDEKQAKKKFTQFKKCTDIYYKQWSQGKSVDRLTVKGRAV